MSKFKIGNGSTVPLNIRLVPKTEGSEVSHVAGLMPAGGVDDTNGLTFDLASIIDFKSRIRLGAMGEANFVNTNFVTNNDQYKLTITDEKVLLECDALLSPDDANYNAREVGLFLKLTEDEYKYVLQTPNNDISLALNENGSQVITYPIADLITNRRKYFDDDYIDLPLTMMGLTVETLDSKENPVYSYPALSLGLPEIHLSVHPVTAYPISGVTLTTNFDEVPVVGSEIPYSYVVKPADAGIASVVVRSTNEEVIQVDNNAKIAIVTGVGVAAIEVEVTDLYGTVFTDRVEYTTYEDITPMTFAVNPTANKAVSVKLTGSNISAFAYVDGFTTATQVGDEVTVSATASTTNPIRLYVSGVVTNVDFSGTKGLTSISDWGAVTAEGYNLKNLVELTTLPSILPTTLKSITGFLQGCVKFNSAVNTWDVSRFENFDYVFDGCSLFDKAVDAWKTIKATSMVATFRNAAKFNKSVLKWTFDKVKSLESFLEGALLFNTDLGAINVGEVENFSKCLKGAAKYNYDLSAWNVESATNMDGAFDGALAYAYSLNYWCVRNIIERPVDFGLTVSASPIWGTCPLDTDTTDIVGVPANVTFANSYGVNVETNYPVLTTEWSVSPVGSAVIDDGILTILTNEVGATITINCLVNSLRSVTTTTKVAETRNGIEFTANNGDTDTVRITATSAIDIDWGDGTTESNVIGPLEHTYGAEGQCILSLLPTGDSFDSVIVEGAVTNVVSWGDYPIDHIAFGSDESMYVTELNSILLPMPESITSYKGLFHNCINFNQSVASIRLTGIKDVSFMFAGCLKYNQSINTFVFDDAVTSLDGMFAGATAYNQPMDKLDVSNITSATRFLNSAIAYKQDLSSWCVANINEEPAGFSTGSGLTAVQLPVWGTCPIIPEVSVLNAIPVTETITTDDKFTLNVSGKLISSKPMSMSELSDMVHDTNIEILEVVDVDTTNAKVTTEAIDLFGRWFVMVGDVLISSDDMSIDELKVALAARGITLEIV